MMNDDHVFVLYDFDSVSQNQEKSLKPATLKNAFYQRLYPIYKDLGTHYDS